MAFSGLITAADVITYAFIDQNVSQSKIKTTKIQIAHYEFLRPFLGDDFYDDIIANPSKNAGYTELITTYLKPALAYYVKYLVIPDISLDLSNNGVQVLSPQNMIPATNDQRAEHRTRAYKDAQALMEAAKKYIEDDENNYFSEYSYNDNVMNKVVKKGGIIIQKTKYY